MRTAALVDYPAVWALKHAVLNEAYALCEAGTDQGLRDDFTRFIAEAPPSLQAFALHEAIRGERGEAWPLWPEALRDPARAMMERTRLLPAIRFILFQQWLCDRQLAEAARRGGLVLGLYRDLAVGAAPDGAEAWAGQGHLARGVSIGAPPDPFAAEGQVWGLPAPIPHRARAEGHRALAGLLRANMRHAGALRIDHAMGLHRLFWVPEGASGREGAYVHAAFDEQMAVLALESARAQCLVIAEDLGTVPDGFRERLQRERILASRVGWLEREGQGFRAPAHFPREAAASLGTHDLPTLTGWWRGTDIAERAALGLIDVETADHQRAERSHERRALAALAGVDETSALAGDSAGPHAGLVAGVHGALAAAPCALMLAQLDDLADEPMRLNLPGTDRERPNWRRKLAEPVPALLASPVAQAALAAIRAHRTAHGIVEEPGAAPSGGAGGIPA
jgi:glycogen operon protein